MTALQAIGVSSLFSTSRMCEHPTNPVEYLANLGVRRIWRFILSHPEMDHLDGFNKLLDRIGIDNFWDSGVRRSTPDFASDSYRSEDWERYVRVRDKAERGVTVITPKSGSRFRYANRNEDGSSGADGLYVLSPTPELVAEANQTQNLNDASYVVLYKSLGGKILLPGDAHDKTWEHILAHHSDDVADCAILVAPHHGRESGRSYDFLAVVRPRLTLFGCAPSAHLAYDAWNSRGLPLITNNQAGSVVGEITDGRIDLYVENARFAEAAGGNKTLRNPQGFCYLTTITNT
jgi:beta-lactamase superfamily II metal-dependent hydrolase